MPEVFKHLFWITVFEPAVFPEALLQVAKATSIIRASAKQWCVNPEKIVVAGFSAGGHVAASLGVYYHEQWLAESLGLTSQDIAPNGCSYRIRSFLPMSLRMKDP